MFGAKTIFRAKTFPPAWTTHNVLLGTQEMSCLEHKECPASNKRNVLLRTQGMSCFDHKECSVSNTRNFLLGTHGMFCFEHTECPSSNIRNFVRRTQGLSFLEHKECPSSNTKNVLLRIQRMSFFVETTQKCDQCDHPNHTSYLQHWSPGWSQDVLGPSQTDVQAGLDRRVLSSTITERFLSVSVSSRESSDVHKM